MADKCKQSEEFFNPCPSNPVVIEPQGEGLKSKLYINSVIVSAKGTWLVSFTRAEEIADGTFVHEKIYIRRSTDKGRTWGDRIDVYDGRLEGVRQAEMGQLVVVPHNNRIYQFSIKHTGVRFGRIVYTYSDDDGITWLGPNGRNSAYNIEVPGYAVAPKGDSNHLMAKGIILDNGEFILPFAVATDPEELGGIEAEVVFMVCDNIFREADPSKLAFKFFPEGRDGLKVPRADGNGSLAHEPHIVQMSDGRLFCTMRTGRGCIYYSVSDDLGRTWASPEPLRYCEGGRAVLHPNAPCPLIKLRSGKYLLFHHNNDGIAFGGTDPFCFRVNRRPIYVAVGRELPNAKGQPMMFTDSKFLMDSDGIPAENFMRTTEISCYSGLIEDGGEMYYIYGNKWLRVEMIKLSREMLDDRCLY